MLSRCNLLNNCWDIHWFVHIIGICILHYIRCNLLNYCSVESTRISQGIIVWGYLKIFVISNYASRIFNCNLIIIHIILLKTEVSAFRVALGTSKFLAYLPSQILTWDPHSFKQQKEGYTCVDFVDYLPK